MKIGIFDSGLGGLIITHSLTSNLPDYDYLYLGDTARVPYGNRSQATIYDFTRQAVEYLFNQDCGLIIVACNTASAEALRKIQRDYLPEHWPDRNAIGVLIPAAEAATAATKTHRVGVLATTGTVTSGAFDREIHKLQPNATVISSAAPLLVPLIENDGLRWSGPILHDYLEPLKGVDTLILGCTHYPCLKAEIRRQMGPAVRVISQDEILPVKLQAYLENHPEYSQQLSQNGSSKFLVTDLTDQAVGLAAQLYGRDVVLELVSLAD